MKLMVSEEMTGLLAVMVAAIQLQVNLLMFLPVELVMTALYMKQKQIHQHSEILLLLLQISGIQSLTLINALVKAMFLYSIQEIQAL